MSHKIDIDRIRAAATRFDAALAGLTDADARADSALAGWSRGHVITHVARSADVYRWLLALARTGSEPGPRADGPALARALAEGAGRPAAELVADLRGSTERLFAEAELMPADRWDTPVTALAGWQHPAWFTLRRCWRELETHRLDLALGPTTADWPADYVAWALDETAPALTARAFPVARIEATDLGRSWELHGEGPVIAAPGHLLLGWLAGRTVPDGRWPTPPAWPQPPAPGWG
ncbi:maleylpyruvate isomerase family mycothiol-dependent enzyme [Kitasatospora viridis]|uniref:Maleylpyruvate isomerase n=1 Tax=Kitasatospora viridis TaxID=281105 RepID=A0A561UG19_9ACTN|nr:maleylpyruvate isomerase family mycothiol-dependent enzyme [Kitasatospora viridis]TWF98312.1 maleylpyruvate isomerase [Kitasatospora viridis]